MPPFTSRSRYAAARALASAGFARLPLLAANGNAVSVAPAYLQHTLKRGIDILGALAGLLLLSPLFVLIAVLVKLDGGPVLFVQPRVGRQGRLFTCYKFRSMQVGAEHLLNAHVSATPMVAREWQCFQKLTKDWRVTRLGRLLRRASLDELPQLFNVLRGDMSLIGPRPILPEQRRLYGPCFRLYVAVRPGLTGAWQVGGRNRLTFPQRVALDAAYVRDWSLARDLVILVRTLPALFRPHEAS